MVRKTPSIQNRHNWLILATRRSFVIYFYNGTTIFITMMMEVSVDIKK